MYFFIVNPTAGGRRGKRVFSKVMKSELYQKIDSRYFLTTHKGHAEEIVHYIVNNHSDEITGIIVIGGDGTLYEVMNGLEGYSLPVSIIPAGSGNDFARACLIGGNPIAILEGIINGHNIMPYWLGDYQVNQNTERHFVNSIGFGFDAEIARTANRSFYKKTLNKLGLGKLCYIIALIQVLIRFKPFDVDIEVNGEKKKISDCWMITISNHPFYGGGMKIIPDAIIQPSVFPVLLIKSISRWKVLGLFMTVFTGKHIQFKELELLKTTNLSIKSNRKIYYQVDGETATCSSCVIAKQTNPVHIMGAGVKQYKKVAL